jgi:hypothetical protein
VISRHSDTARDSSIKEVEVRLRLGVAFASGRFVHCRAHRKPETGSLCDRPIERDASSRRNSPGAEGRLGHHWATSTASKPAWTPLSRMDPEAGDGARTHDPQLGKLLRG